MIVMIFIRINIKGTEDSVTKSSQTCLGFGRETMIRWYMSDTILHHCCDGTDYHSVIIIIIIIIVIITIPNIIIIIIDIIISSIVITLLLESLL